MELGRLERVDGCLGMAEAPGRRNRRRTCLDKLSSALSWVES